jgi:dTDP-4-amino-4,6-dideoxygalactose transaminase
MDTSIVPRLDPRVEVEAVWDDLSAAVNRVLRSGCFIGGEEVEKFEQEIGRYLGVEHALGVASGTDALTIALMVTGGGRDHEGMEVITTPMTFAATGSAVLRAGLRLRFVDVDEGSFNLTAEGVASAIGPETAAVLPVHLYGLAVDVDAIRMASGELTIIEDAAQAFGARAPSGALAGTMGTAGAFSFFPSKPLGGCGDGGLLVTRDRGLAETARLVARHGARRRYVSERPGFNSRLDALQAAILRVKLGRVDAAREQRGRLAGAYRERLAGIPWLQLPEDAPGHAWHCYTVRINSEGRDRLLDHLRGRGVDAVIQYPVPLHQMPPFATGQRLPVAERLSSELICLPIWAGMTDAQVDRVVEAVRSWNHARR